MSRLKTVCIVQARTGSTRLPGKVLEPILGRPMLWWVCYRLAKCRLVDEIVVATTEAPADSAIVELCEREGWPCVVGSEDDVLDRYYQAAKRQAADCVVRVTSDCPLIDPSVTDLVIAAFNSAAPAVDYASNGLRRTYPRGLDSEVFTFAALEAAWRDDASPDWREHVTPFIYRNLERFALLEVTNPVDYSAQRWTVDTPEDLEFVRRVYAHFGDARFGWREVLDALEAHPDWSDINRQVRQKALP